MVGFHGCASAWSLGAGEIFVPWPFDWFGAGERHERLALRLSVSVCAIGEQESGLVRGDALGCWKIGSAMSARAWLELGRQELTQMIRWRQMRTGCKKAPNQAVQATPNDAFSSAVADGTLWLGVPDLGR